MKSKEDLLKELDYHGAGCLKQEIEHLYSVIDTLIGLVPSWARVEIDKMVDQNETK